MGDVNGDGNADVVTANFSSNNVSVLLGDGRGNFVTQTTVGSYPDSVSLGDLNGDGNADVVTTKKDNVLVLLNTTEKGDSTVHFNDKGISYKTFNPQNGSGELSTFGGSNQVSYSNIEHFDITGTMYRDDLRGGNLADNLAGGDGDDTIASGLGVDSVDGGAGNDVLVVDYSSLKGNLVLNGSGSNGKFSADKNNSITFNSFEQFNITTGSGNDSITGGNLSDTIASGLGFDSVAGGAGIDTLVVDYSSLSSNLVFDGSASNGEFSADKNNKISFGGFEQFNITTGSGNDSVVGGSGIDTLVGGAGDDTIDGGIGNNILTGGSGKDVFYKSTLDKDTITDFVVTDDTIQLESSIFTALTKTGVLDVKNFNFGATAKDSDDYIFYDAGKGVVFYDADGNGNKVAAIQIALLGTGLALTNADFVIV
jgi:Ca2+-binding RTX toxin-like protein